ncbi:hypothetical protein [Streptomyces albidoflavus]|uniref:hypothetical protein n=1 Tax=Streptomyces albidoflavus TaxID=1886 RepID=UPI00101F084C|nr:hypothetical protein [Streptomyces albidoflavus]RZE13353.1 hypothetical protein C0Q66_07040 [Streptomyces albidoflavus]
MTLTFHSSLPIRTRDPRELLNAVEPAVRHLSVNVLDSGMTLWDREVTLLLRDNTMVRDMAERILGNAVMYTVASIEHPDAHLGVGKLVDIGVHQLILDTPVWWAICDVYNGGAYKHHAPFLQRRSDGLCLRTAAFLRGIGFQVDDELWAIDGANCSPCDDKVPDSH